MCLRVCLLRHSSTLLPPIGGHFDEEYDYLFKVVLIGDSGVGPSPNAAQRRTRPLNSVARDAHPSLLALPPSLSSQANRTCCRDSPATSSTSNRSRPSVRQPAASGGWNPMRSPFLASSDPARCEATGHSRPSTSLLTLSLLLPLLPGLTRRCRVRHEEHPIRWQGPCVVSRRAHRRETHGRDSIALSPSTSSQCLIHSSLPCMSARPPSCLQVIKAQIWDTAGQERYRAITSAYYRGAGQWSGNTSDALQCCEPCGGGGWRFVRPRASEPVAHSCVLLSSPPLVSLASFQSAPCWCTTSRSAVRTTTSCGG